MKEKRLVGCKEEAYPDVRDVNTRDGGWGKGAIFVEKYVAWPLDLIGASL